MRLINIKRMIRVAAVRTGKLITGRINLISLPELIIFMVHRTEEAEYLAVKPDNREELKEFPMKS